MTKVARGPLPPTPTATTLRALPLLADLHETRLKQMAQVAQWCQHGPGAVIAHQNEASERVYFVVTGFVKIVRGDTMSDGRCPSAVSERRGRARPRVMLALLGPGDIIGEVSLLMGGGRCASIVALTGCQIISIPGEHIIGSLLESPAFAISLARSLARRLADANRQVELMHGKLEGRIRALFRYGHEMGLDIETSLTNAEIARMVGATRVAVSKILNGPENGQRNVPAPKEFRGKA